MNELPSAEFRKRFARLTETTVVTVHGHAIGTWTPVTVGPIAETVRATSARVDAPPGGHSFGRPRPAPKPGH